jgi:peptide/nickel transport system permease protein
MLALVAVIVVTRWTDVARLARGEARRLRGAEFVTAARALGAGPARILTRHVLPNALPPLLVAAAFGVGQAVLLESALSYLGFGVQPPGPSWGEIISEASAYGTQAGAWWLALFPGLCLLGTVAGMNLAADDLRRRLDPLGKRL